MRGKQRFDAADKLLIRITPADAGKTQRERIQGDLFEDHPRGCGENRSEQGKAQSDGGSPPRMRGKQIVEAFCELLDGITPADAGKTLSIAVSYISSKDHPRGCGENR